jgi:hypothetical protein
MKNIDNDDVQNTILSILDGHGCGLCPMRICGDKSDYEHCDEKYSTCRQALYEWFQKEYIEPKEPHNWEPWELEAMRNIPKRIVYLERRHDTSLPRALQKDDCYADHGICTQINFPSLKNEKINIDAELERNGMHR